MNEITNASTRREIIVLIFIFLFTIGIGVLFYHHFEALAWIDAIYFTCVTLTTLGYGDIAPQTDIGKLFTSIYAFLGVGMFLGVAGIVFRKSLSIHACTHRGYENVSSKKRTSLLACPFFIHRVFAISL